MIMKWIPIGALLAGLTVAAGAFGAHALKARLSERLFGIYQTAVEYQFYHSLGLILFGLWLKTRTTEPSLAAQAPGWAFLAGMVLFSGSLYALVATNIKWLGAITPLGGLSFIVGWILFAFLAWKA